MSEPSRDELWALFNAAYGEVMKSHHGTEPLKARIAGFDAVVNALRAGPAATPPLEPTEAILATEKHPHD